MCSKKEYLNEGKKIAKQMNNAIKRGTFQSNIIVETTLLKFYGKCGDLATAEQIFENIKSKDLNCWTAMISCYTQQEKGREAIELFNTNETRRNFT